MISPKPLLKFKRRPHLFPDLIEMVEVVGESRVYIRKGDAGKVRNDLMGSHPLMLVPHHNVEHTVSMTRDAGFPATDPFRFGDPGFAGTSHSFSISVSP